MNSTRSRLAALIMSLPLLAACSSGAGTSLEVPVSSPEASAPASPGPAAVQRGVVYCTDAGVALTMDIYHPSQAGRTPTPPSFTSMVVDGNTAIRRSAASMR